MAGVPTHVISSSQIFPSGCSPGLFGGHKPKVATTSALDFIAAIGSIAPNSADISSIPTEDDRCGSPTPGFGLDLLKIFPLHPTLQIKILSFLHVGYYSTLSLRLKSPPTPLLPYSLVPALLPGPLVLSDHFSSTATSPIKDSATISGSGVLNSGGQLIFQMYVCVLPNIKRCV